MATECFICTFPFDDAEVKPVTGSCGHSLCLKCCRVLESKKCPICQRDLAFLEESVSFQMIELLEACKLKEGDCTAARNEKETLKKKNEEKKLELEKVKKQAEEALKQLNDIKAKEQNANQNRDKCSECGSLMDQKKTRLCQSCCEKSGFVSIDGDQLKIVDLEQTDKSVICSDCVIEAHMGHHTILYGKIRMKYRAEADFRRIYEVVDAEKAKCVEEYGHFDPKFQEFWKGLKQFGSEASARLLDNSDLAGYEVLLSKGKECEEEFKSAMDTLKESLNWANQAMEGLSARLKWEMMAPGTNTLNILVISNNKDSRSKLIDGIEMYLTYKTLAEAHVGEFVTRSDPVIEYEGLKIHSIHWTENGTQRSLRLFYKPDCQDWTYDRQIDFISANGGVHAVFIDLGPSLPDPKANSSVSLSTLLGKLAQKQIDNVLYYLPALRVTLFYGISAKPSEVVRIYESCTAQLPLLRSSYSSLSAEELDRYSNEWIANVKEMAKLLLTTDDRVLQSQSNISRILASMARPLGEIVRVLLSNLSREPMQRRGRRHDSNESFNVSQTELTPVKLETSRIVCYSWGCTKVEGSDIQPKTCRDAYEWESQGINVLGSAFETGRCECRCPWQMHLYSAYDFKEDTRTTDVLGSKFNRMHIDLDRLRQFIVEASVFYASCPGGQTSDPFMDYFRFLDETRVFLHYVKDFKKKCQTEIDEMKRCIQHGRRSALTQSQMKAKINDLLYVDAISPMLKLQSWGLLELPSTD